MASLPQYSFLILCSLILAMLLLIGRFRCPPFIVLLLAAWFLAALSGMPLSEITPLVRKGMGELFGDVALIIIMGTLLGNILERSGGALLLADRLINLIGHRHPALALSIAGYLVSIPVYCDSGFILLNSLRKSIAEQGQSHPFTLSTGLAGGLYATHTFVPPTPGPAAAALVLGISPSLAIPLGLLLALWATLIALAWGKLSTRRMPPLKCHDVKRDVFIADENRSSLLALLPIATPLVLMSLATLCCQANESELAAFAAQPANALFIGLLATIPLYRNCQGSFHELFSDSIRSCANVILIIAAGGALAGVLKETGHVTAVTDMLPDSLGLLLPFCIAAILKISQGSTTVALISAASMTEAMLPSLGLDSDSGRLLAMMSAGAGAMVVAYANDSYFWVVTQFSEMDARTGYKTFTMATLLQGLGSLLLILAISPFLLS
ncbi:MAG: GntP family permease [Endozoicomonas sp.]